MSLSASPAWNSTRLCEPSATEAPISACGPSPYGRPMHQAASRAIDSQPRLSTGETLSRLEEQDRERVQDLGVRGVERGEEDRVEEVDLAEVAGLHEPRRERHVVPEAVGAVHAGGERPQGRHHPGGGERGAGEHGDHAGEPPGRRRGRRRGRPHGPAVGQPGGDQARAPGPPPPGRRARRPPSNPPKLPSASQTQIRPATASTASASRAGAPDQPGSSRARTR